MGICVVFVVGKVAWNVKWHEGRKDLNNTKNGSKGKTPDRQKKKKKKKNHPEHGCLPLVSVVCCQVEVSATSWSLVQRSPTDCGVSQMCVIVKTRRNEEAQAHIGLSSHKKKECLEGHRHAQKLAGLHALCQFLSEFSNIWKEVESIFLKSLTSNVMEIHFLKRVCRIAKRNYLFHHVCLPSVCPSVLLSTWNNSAPTGRILMKFNIWIFFRKSVKKIQISLKSDKNNGYIIWRPIHIYDISMNSS
jgi:hypothetical protein